MHALITSNTLANPMTADVTMTTPTSANHVESSPPTTVTCIKPDEDTVGGCSGGGDKDKHVRRHSASSIGVATGGDVGSVAPSASSRRHSLPPSSGSAGGDSERSSQRGEEDEEEEETEEEEEEKQKLIKPDPVGASDVILPSPVSATTHAQNGGLVVKTAPPSLESNGSAGGAAGLGHLKNGDAEPVTA